MPELGQVILLVLRRGIVHFPEILAHIENHQHRAIVPIAVLAVNILLSPRLPDALGYPVPVGQRMRGRIADKHDETHAQLSQTCSIVAI